MSIVEEREAALSDGAKICLAALRAAGCEYEDHRSDFTIWRGIYLDNARPTDMSRHSWAGYLSALEERKLYRPTNEDFGEVLIGED